MPLSSSERAAERGRAVAAMSGGVDSSVAAMLAAQGGVEVMGVTLGLPGADAASARAVCSALGIEHREEDASAAFEARVLEPFIAAYARGRTPNPCVICNPLVKFAALAGLADELGCDGIVTGHYARVRREVRAWHLLRALDRGKDQSYMLYRLPQSILARLRVPLGELTKDEVRALADEAGLPVTERPESQDACFAPDGEVAALVAATRPDAARSGPILDRTGEEIGRHRGLAHYTVGQRRGLGIGGPGGPLYVLRIDAERNALIVGAEEELWVARCAAEDVAIVGEPPGPEFAARVVTRYRGTETPALVRLDGQRATIRFARPHRAPAPGQSAVFYCGERLVGGGIIVPEPD